MMKSILQSESAECGLISIAMIASHYGQTLSIHSLREQFPQSLKGLSLNQLIDIAATLGMSSRPLKLELDEISQLSLPCILHWELNHFVVLKKVTKTQVTIYDPAKGIYKLSLTEFAKFFTGVALELSPNKDFHSIKPLPSLKLTELNVSFKGLFTSLSQLFVLSLMLQILLLLMPYYMQTIIDDVLVSYDTNLLTVLAIAFAFIVLFKHAFSLLRGYLIIHLGTEVGRQITELLFNHLIRLPLAYFEARHVADIVSRFQSIEQIKRMLAHKFIEACIDGLMASLTLIILFIYQPTLALVTLATIVVYLILRLMWYRPFKRVSEQVIKTNADEQAFFMESIRAIQSIKLMALEPKRVSLWLNKFVSSLNQRIKIERLQLHFGLINGFLFGLENILVIYLGATYVLESNEQSIFTLGMLLAFISYKTQVTSRFSALIDTFIDFKMLSLHFTRISDIALSNVEIVNNSGTEVSLDKQAKTALYGPSGVSKSEDNISHINIKNLTFTYPQESQPLFKNLSMSILEGESIAIVGKSGLGKSTLLKVLIGLLKPTAGEILFYGRTSSDIDIKSFRQNTAAVMQNDQLLTGSIAENIANFDSPINIQKVKECAHVACIDQDIAEMPMQYDSYIGEMGSALSGGQTQRILLARALYHDPSILFLDEATSNLDIKTEKLINQRLICLGITTIFIAHRLETIKHANRVFELTQTSLQDVSRDYY